jgi:hypothetical protein
MNQLDQLLTEAEKNAGASGDGIYKKRVALLRDSIYATILKERNKSVAGALGKTESPHEFPRAGGGIFFSQSLPQMDSRIYPPELKKQELGLKFSIQKSGTIKSFFFYQSKGETGGHTLRLWDQHGKLIMSVDVPEKRGDGWINAPLSQPYKISPGDVFILSCTMNKSFVQTLDVLSIPRIRDGATAIQGVYRNDRIGENAPDKAYRNSNYFLDIEAEFGAAP